MGRPVDLPHLRSEKPGRPLDRSAVGHFEDDAWIPLSIRVAALPPCETPLSFKQAG
jgi:hypothetical protein